MITFKQYLTEKALNSKVFADAIERLSSSAKLGFELEMWVPEDSDLLIVGDEEFKGDFKKTANEASKSLEDLLGVDVKVNGIATNKWKIVPDGSIQEGGVGCGIEVVSPPLPVEDALGDLKQCFKWMDKHDVVTNSTTGIHLNLSIPGLEDKLDPLKLILFMGEDHILKSYERSANTYAQKHMSDLIDAIRKTGSIPKSASRLHALATAALKKEKYRTVNLSKLDQGYLEFRTAGNENYHKKYNQIAGDVGRFLTVLELACDPDAERQEYLKKIAKLFNKGKEARAASRNMSMSIMDEPSSNDSLAAIIGDGNVNLMRVSAEPDFKDDGKTVTRIARIMKNTGAEISAGRIETVSTKNIAEFKLLLSKIIKKNPDLLKQVKASATSQVELDDIKAFQKAFNIK